MSLSETLLAIRREYSKDEKYKLFLQHLTRMEDALRLEHKKGLKLLKENNSFKEEIKIMKHDLVICSQKLEARNVVSGKTHQKLADKYHELEIKYYELVGDFTRYKEKLLTH